MATIHAVAGPAHCGPQPTPEEAGGWADPARLRTVAPGELAGQREYRPPVPHANAAAGRPDDPRAIGGAGGTRALLEESGVPSQRQQSQRQRRISTHDISPDVSTDASTRISSVFSPSVICDICAHISSDVSPSVHTDISAHARPVELLPHGWRIRRTAFYLGRMEAAFAAVEDSFEEAITRRDAATLKPLCTALKSLKSLKTVDPP